jgi:hypothetical protein
MGALHLKGGVGDNHQTRIGGCMFVRLLVAVILCCGSLAHAQEPDVKELPRPEFGGLNQKQVAKRIFSAERDLLSKLGFVRFDMALGEKSEGGIDDAYVLALSLAKCIVTLPSKEC